MSSPWFDSGVRYVIGTTFFLAFQFMAPDESEYSSFWKRDEGWGKESESRGKQIPTEHQGWNNACLREFSTASQCPTGSVQFSTACTHSPLVLYKYDHYVEVICLHFYVSTTITTVYFYPIFYPMVTWPLLAIRLSLSRDLGLWYHSNSCINRRK